MAETENNAAEAAPKKKSKKLLIIIIAVVVLVTGGGGFYFWTRMVSAKAAAAEAKEEKPAKTKEAGSSDKFSLPDDDEVKNVVELQPFIVNLADIDQARYLRMTVSVGVGEDGGAEGKPDVLFLTRIKNAMLSVLTVKKSSDVLTVEGKQKLREELLQAAQAASEKPKVKAIYITDFIVQL